MNINLEEKLGQMFIIRMHGKTITKELETLIKDYHIGGISLYSRNYDSYEEMQNLINDLKKLNTKYNNTPLFIAVDQEGGRVNRLPKEFKNLPSAKILSEKNKVEEAGNIIGELLNEIGINMNFAPVLDIQRFKDDHAIGDRCFGSNKEDVITNSVKMINSLKNYLVPVVKHFPGHGLVKRDSHLFLSFVKEDIEKTDDIEPFKNAINNNVPAIMMSHIIISKIDKMYPASLSKKVIKDYLVDKLNYKGLIITDDLKMKAVNILYGYKKSTLKAIDAGNNIVLIGADYKIVSECIDYIKFKMNDSIKDNIVNSYNKIIELKKEYKINDEQKKKINIDYYNERINKIREKD